MNDQPIRQPEWPRDAWKLSLELDVPTSSLPAIEYAIFSQDPIPRFKAILGRMEQKWRAQLNATEDEERRQTMRQLQRAVAWTHLFRSVSGDEVYLLTPGRAHTALMSNSSPGKKWVVSKPVAMGDKRLCWSLPFEAVVGEKAEIRLSEDTALDLLAIENASNSK